MSKRVNGNLKFRYRILIICILCSIVPVIILGTYCYRRVSELLIDRERTTLSDSLLLTSSTFGAQLREYENLAAQIAWNDSLKSALNSRYDNNFEMYLFYRDVLSPVFYTTTSANEAIVDITLYSDLDIYSDKDKFKPLREISGAPWYEKAAGEFRPVWYCSMEEKELAVICSFYNVSAPALVKIDLDYDRVFSVFTSIYEESYGILMTDEEGVPVFRYATADLRGEEAKTGEGYISEVEDDFYRGWTIRLYRPSGVILRSTGTIIRSMILIVAICLVCVLLLAYIFSYTVVRPLKKLTADMERAKAGDYTITAVDDSTDEIGTLSRAFAGMIEQINYLVNKELKVQILQQEQELKMLQAQIHPHFLYNTLSMINNKAIINGQAEIGQIALSLSNFYRTSLNGGRDVISVKDELVNVRSYISIQLQMHSDSFDVEYCVDDDILSCEILNMLLQPLVENAIVHGIDESEKPERGLIRIIGTKAGGRLVFHVTDNGPGIPAKELAGLLACDSAGYGIKNIHKRIQLFYGSEYGLSYRSEEGIGTTATITLPCGE